MQLGNNVWAHTRATVPNCLESRQKCPALLSVVHDDVSKKALVSGQGQRRVIEMAADF
jgi:hypothetical protein